MINSEEINKILSDSSPQLTEDLARQAAALTQQYFGRTISLYAPLYLSNYCTGGCLYCGFNQNHSVQRIKLNPEQIEAEMLTLAAMGIKNILLLTGESYDLTPVEYLCKAVCLGRKYFSQVGLEIHPLETSEYSALYLAGADSLTVYQETYDRTRYAEVHLHGRKRDYDFRYGAAGRASAAHFRQISLGILLGLSKVANDLASLYNHLRYMERQYPGVEYSLSFPRLRRIKGENFIPDVINDQTFMRIIALSRILFPRVGINLSTREQPDLRDRLLGIGVTKISAGSKTTVGGYHAPAEQRDPQFDVQDSRSVEAVIRRVKKLGFDPVITDWRAITNE
ncbi:MAG: 2-iminoacetate synthase ThiH [Candidatus Omnitrophica bacterium]|nr:2-iminoacetate synthase ThiH [Candidatus Omnitrophota bacterium]